MAKESCLKAAQELPEPINLCCLLSFTRNRFEEFQVYASGVKVGNLWCQEGDMSNMAMFSCEKSNSLELRIAVQGFHSSSKPSASTFHKHGRRTVYSSKSCLPVWGKCSMKLWLLLIFKQDWTLHLWVGGTHSMWKSADFHVICRNVHISYNKNLKKFIMLNNLHWQCTFSRLNP